MTKSEVCDLCRGTPAMCEFCDIHTRNDIPDDVPTICDYCNLDPFECETCDEFKLNK